MIIIARDVYTHPGSWGIDEEVMSVARFAASDAKASCTNVLCIARDIMVSFGIVAV